MAPTPSQLADAQAWLDHYASTTASSDAATSAAVWSAYSEISDWTNPDQTLEAAKRAVSTILAAQRKDAGLGSEFVEYYLQLLTGKRPPRDLKGGSTYARNARPFDVYSRPVFTYRDAIDRGIEADQALAEAKHRAEVLALTDSLLARRDAAIAAIDASIATHYRRIIRPELSQTGTCGLCIAAATRVYSTDDLLPIHSRCKCTVLPILDGVDPDQWNQHDLEKLYSENPATKRADLANTRYVVQADGELGPVLKPVKDQPTVPRAGLAPKRSLDSTRSTDDLRKTLAELQASDSKFSTTGTRKRIDELRQELESRGAGGEGGGGAGPRRGMLGPEGPDEFPEFNGYRPPAKRSQIDTFELDDASHVLDYDPQTAHGGHRSGSAVGKDEFPAGWGEPEVQAFVQAIVDNPSNAVAGAGGGRFSLYGTYDGVYGVVHVQPTGSPNSWYVATAYPQPLGVPSKP